MISFFLNTVYTHGYLAPDWTVEGEKETSRDFRIDSPAKQISKFLGNLAADSENISQFKLGSLEDLLENKKT